MDHVLTKLHICTSPAVYLQEYANLLAAAAGCRSGSTAVCYPQTRRATINAKLTKRAALIGQVNITSIIPRWWSSLRPSLLAAPARAAPSGCPRFFVSRLQPAAAAACISTGTRRQQQSDPRLHASRWWCYHRHVTAGAIAVHAGSQEQTTPQRDCFRLFPAPPPPNPGVSLCWPSVSLCRLARLRELPLLLVLLVSRCLGALLSPLHLHPRQLVLDHLSTNINRNRAADEHIQTVTNTAYQHSFTACNFPDTAPFPVIMLPSVLNTPLFNTHMCIEAYTVTVHSMTRETASTPCQMSPAAGTEREACTCRGWWLLPCALHPFLGHTPPPPPPTHTHTHPAGRLLHCHRSPHRLTCILLMILRLFSKRWYSRSSFWFCSTSWSCCCCSAVHS